MIKITVPATSANIGPGFDCLGVALTLYNSFYFEKCDNKFMFKDVLENYANENNLVIKASLLTYEYLNIKPIYYRLSEEEGIPSARGLGSSATCVVAGILAACYFAGIKLTAEEIINLGTRLEGHPDNVAPAVLGTLVSSVKSEKIIYNKHNVSQNLRFTVVIPNFKLKTSEARKVLPNTISYEDAVYNMSRAINIPITLSKGTEESLEDLYELLKDKMHQPYRLKLINKSDKFQEYADKNHIPFCISGSGSTMLFISLKPIIKDLQRIVPSYMVRELKVSQKGGQVYEK